jgi:hypothetical protein
MPEIIEFLEKYGVEHSTTDKHSRHGWVQCSPCPTCQSSKFHLGIKLDGTRSSCYKCGSFQTAKLLKQLTDAPWSEIKALLGDSRFVPDEPEKVYGGYKPPKDLGPLGPGHRKYLIGRNLDPDELAVNWGIQGTGPFSEYPHRVFLPISRNGKPVSWTARTVLKGVEPRYQTAQDHQKSYSEKKLLFGQDKFKGNAVIVTEGPFDAINLGFGAVALLGLAYNNEQLHLLSRYARRVIALDSSDEAQRVADKLCEDLAVFPGETIRLVVDAKDPGSADKSEVESIRKFVFGKV